MTASLTPALALDYITALSADIRAAVVLDAAGEHLAGPAELARAARDAPARRPASRAETERGAVFAARDERHAIVVVDRPVRAPPRHPPRPPDGALRAGRPKARRPALRNASRTPS